jgi:Ras GTPase-activating-like protein IQGAP2/3
VRKIFFPEVTDLYNRKNMPRVIYCIHALSRFLFHLGIAPLIEDLHGVVQFTEEELTAMEAELQKLGVQMPKFGKIGGILAAEMGVDEAASA